MPWEYVAGGAHAMPRSARLKTAGVQVKEINVTLGGCAFWHADLDVEAARRRQERAARRARSWT
jgi:2,5-furandicarboxylate decarboxylase 1